MNAQKISELKAAEETLAHFLLSLPSSFEAQIFYAVILFGFCGMLLNLARRWLQREKIRFDWRHLILSAGTTIGTGAGLIAAGTFDNEGAFVGWWNVAVVTFNLGFTFDVVTAKAPERKEWSESQRAARTEAKP